MARQKVTDDAWCARVLKFLRSRPERKATWAHLSRLVFGYRRKREFFDGLVANGPLTGMIETGLELRPDGTGEVRVYALRGAHIATDKLFERRDQERREASRKEERRRRRLERTPEQRREAAASWARFKARHLADEDEPPSARSTQDETGERPGERQSGMGQRPIPATMAAVAPHSPNAVSPHAACPPNAAPRSATLCTRHLRVGPGILCDLPTRQTVYDEEVPCAWQH